MSAQASGNRRLDASQELAGLDEPVRRYLTHALDDGAMLPSSAQLQMRGVIDPGVRLSFEATQRFDGHAFVWTARAGLGRVRPLQVVDRYDGRGQGSTEGVAFGRLRFLHADGPDTGRAAAGRAAAESVWRPWLLLPAAGVTWRAETAELIVASFDVGPERVDLNLRIAADGALRTVSLDRWGDAGRKDFGYIPFGGDVLQERRFGDWTVPSRLRVGWWYGTPRSKVFFDATVLSLAGC